MKKRGFWLILIGTGIVGYFLGVAGFGLLSSDRFSKELAASLQMEELEFEEAIGSYSHVIGLDPHNALAYAGRAWAYYATQEYEKAKSDFEMSRQISKTFVSPGAGLAFIYTRSNKQDQSIAMLTDALTYQHTPNSASILYMALGFANIKNKDLYAAIVDFNNALALDQNSLTSYVGQVIAYSEVGDLQRADAAYQKVLAAQGIDTTLERIFYQCLELSAKGKDDVIACGMKLFEEI